MFLVEYGSEQQKILVGDLENAVAMIRNGKSYRETSRAFGVPVSTINDAVFNRYSNWFSGGRKIGMLFGLCIFVCLFVHLSPYS